MKEYLIKNKWLVLALLSIPLLSFSAPLHIQFSGNYGYSDVNGFIQIPNGGQPGTTTLHKPALSDIGIKHDNLWDAQIDVMKNAEGIFLNYQNQEYKSHGILNETLVTHGVNFPAGTLVNSSIKFNLLTTGVYYNFIHQKLILRPILAVTELSFYYSLSSQIQLTQREFSQVTPRLGLALIYQITPKFNLSLTGLSSILHLVNTAIYSAEVKGDYTLYETSHYTVDAFAGMAYQQITFKDHQTVPNDFHLTNYPIIFLGISIKI